MSRTQLLDAGLSPSAVEHRLRNGRLYPVRRGVYALGRPDLSARGRWMAAVLACGPRAALSHRSAAALWCIAPDRGGFIEVSAPTRHRGPGLTVHESGLDREVTKRDGIPVTRPARTLVDLASALLAAERTRAGPTARKRRRRRASKRSEGSSGSGIAVSRVLESAIKEADALGLIDPESLRSALDRYRHHPGVGVLREVLDRRTFVMTDSELERRFLPIARRAGLPMPRAGAAVNGFRVDFFWPDLGLLVETDGLTYHRTPSQQSRDRVRDQVHTAAGLTCLRFTHAQVRWDPDHVARTLRAVADRLRLTLFDPSLDHAITRPTQG